MHAHYMKGKYIITEVGVNPMDSGTWKWIVSSRENVMQCMTPVSIANGTELIHGPGA